MHYPEKRFDGEHDPVLFEYCSSFFLVLFVAHSLLRVFTTNRIAIGNKCSTVAP